MNERELPLWLKWCLLYDVISKVFKMPVDVSETILRYLSSREKKTSYKMIYELKVYINKYKSDEHIVFMKDKSVWHDDLFYDDTIGRGTSISSSITCEVDPPYLYLLSTRRWNYRNRIRLPHKLCRREFCESFLPYGNGIKIYELLLEDELGVEIVKSGRNIYNLNIPRFLSLSRCKIDFENRLTVGELAAFISMSRADVFYDCVDSPIRGTHACMSIENKRRKFYKYSGGISTELLEQEAEYYIYLEKTSLLKVFKEICK